MRILLILFVMLLANGSQAAENSILNFDQLGFKIQALEGISDSNTSQPLTLMLPPSNGFSPNVTVIMQPYRGTMEEYKAVTDRQLNQAKLNIIQSEIKDDIYIFGNASKIVEVNKISHIGIGTTNKNFQSTGAVVSPIFIPGVHGR